MEDDMENFMGFQKFGKQPKFKVTMEQVLQKTRLGEDNHTYVNNVKPTDEIDLENFTKPSPLGSTAKSQQTQPKPPSSDDEPSSDEDNKSTNTMRDKIPLTNVFTMNHGIRGVSSITFDKSGSRMITAGLDFNMCMWDFATMDSKAKSFRQFTPIDDHQLKTIQFNYNCELMLIIGANSQAHVLDRDGVFIIECSKGDQYLTDLANVKGHISMLTSGFWDPIINECFWTSSIDSTIRMWHIEDDKKSKYLIRVKDRLGRRVPVDYSCIDSTGNIVFAACRDGSIKLWDRRKSYINCAQNVLNAHENDSVTTCLACSTSNLYLVSRGGDNTLKKWDVRNLKTSLGALDNLPNDSDVTKCAFSPNNDLIITGTTVSKDGTERGKIVFVNSSDMTLNSYVNTGDLGALSFNWHPILNQLFVGLTDGSINVYFDPQTSQKGIMHCISKVNLPKYDPGEALLAPAVIIPLGIREREIYTVDTSKKLKEKARRDPIKSRKPEPPIYGPGQGGRLGTGLSLSAFVCQQLLKRTYDDSDPREAILKYAKESEENPYFVAPAYAKTQPKTLYQDQVEEPNSEDGEDEAASNKNFKKIA